MMPALARLRPAQPFGVTGMKSAQRSTIEDYERLLARLASLAQALAVASDLAAVYRSLLEFVRNSGPCNGMFVALYDPDRKERRCVYAWSEGREEDVTHLPLLPMNDSPNSRAVRTGEIVITDDYQAAVTPSHPGVSLGEDIDPRPPQSSIAVPMAVMSRVIGAMEIQSVELAAFTQEHVTALRMAGPLAGMAIENVRLLEDERRLRRRAEDSERRKAAILESAFDAIVTTDHEGRVVEFNAAAERMFGYSQSEVAGRDLAGLILPSPSKAHDSAAAAHPLAIGRGALRTGRAEMLALRKDGAEFSAKVTITRIDRINPSLFTACIRDITKLNREKHERESLEDQLRESQKMEAIGTLAGGIAHDFNNILAAILGNAELAREEAGANSRALKSIDEIGNAANRARELVRQILSFSRRQPTSRVLVALPSIVEESVRLLRATLPAGIAIDWREVADAPCILADRTQVVQVLLNLGANAAHAMAGRPGSIAIGVGRVDLDEASASRVADLRPGAYARITFSDTGEGMDGATLRRIFEPFFTTKRAGEGTGLGLSVVHGILRIHEGAIQVHSKRGKGTRFELYFPAAAGVVPSAGTKVCAVAARGIGQHILYIDDDNALVELFRRRLERLGYRVSGYVDAREALERLRADPAGFDLVVTDYNMPRMSGLDVARSIRSFRPALPVVLTSGYITDELRSQASAAGVEDVLLKPNSSGELHEVLQRLAASIIVERRAAIPAQDATVSPACGRCR